MTSAVRWVLSFTSAYTLSLTRQALANKGERRPEHISQFVVNALVAQLVITHTPGLTPLLNDLRYQLQTDHAPDLPKLPPRHHHLRPALIPSRRRHDHGRHQLLGHPRLHRAGRRPRPTPVAGPAGGSNRGTAALRRPSPHNRAGPREAQWQPLGLRSSVGCSRCRPAKAGAGGPAERTPHFVLSDMESPGWSHLAVAYSAIGASGVSLGVPGSRHSPSPRLVEAHPDPYLRMSTENRAAGVPTSANEVTPSLVRPTSSM